MTTHNPAMIDSMPATALVDRKAFAGALARVSKVTERRNTIPILANVRLTGAGESIVVEGTDLDIWHAITVPAAADSRFAVTAPAHLLATTCKRMASEYVEARQGDSLCLDFEGAATSLQTLPVADWPDAAAFNKSWGPAVASFTMSAPMLRRVLAATSPAISTEETRYYLNGVFLHVVGDRRALKLRSVATDGHRLVSATIDLPAGAESMPKTSDYGAASRGVIVPRKTVAVVLAELKRKGAPDFVAVAVGAAWIRFTIGAGIITSKVIDGTFPDYARVIPDGNDKVATVDAKAFVAMVKAVSTIASERGRAVKLSFAHAGTVRATVDNPDSGSASQSIACTYEAPEPIEIGFNAKYLVDLVELIGGKRVKITMGDAGGPARIEPAENIGDGVDVLAVCMPMQV